MKIELIRVPAKVAGTEELIPNRQTTVGWNLIAETTEDKLILGSIRMIEFWGSKETKIEYAGYSPDSDNDNYVGVIHYATKYYKKQKEEAFRKSIQKELNKDQAEDDKNADLHI